MSSLRDELNEMEEAAKKAVQDKEVSARMEVVHTREAEAQKMIIEGFTRQEILDFQSEKYGVHDSTARRYFVNAKKAVALKDQDAINEIKMVHIEKCREMLTEDCTKRDAIMIMKHLEDLFQIHKSDVYMQNNINVTTAEDLLDTSNWSQEDLDVLQKLIEKNKR